MTTLEKIRAEIEEARYGLINDGLDVALKILDKYAEQEPTENPMKVNEMEYEYEKSKALFHKIVECEDTIRRQAVLDLIEHYNSDGLGSVFYGYEQGVKFANAVNKLPSVKQKPIECDDVVSRQAVLDIVNNPLNIRLDEIIKKLPSVRPQEQKSGKWIAQQEPNGDDYFKAYDISGVMTYAAKYKCDKCGFIQTCIEDHGQYTFCPNCGCRMVEPQESEESE